MGRALRLILLLLRRGERSSVRWLGVAVVDAVMHSKSKFPEAMRDESGQRQPIGGDVLESPKNTQNPQAGARRACFSFLFYQEHQFNRLDSHEGAVGAYIYQALCLVTVCPSRFRDQILPVVNRTSDIKKLSTMCFISGKHSFACLLCSCIYLKCQQRLAYV